MFFRCKEESQGSVQVFGFVVSSWLAVPLIRMNCPLSFLISFGLKSVLL